MHTLFDFVSNVNATQYGLTLLFVLGFIIFTEILKNRPFKELVQSAAEDVRFIKAQGKERNTQLIKNIASAPLYLVSYLVAVPLLFVQGMSEPIGRGLGSLTTAEWSPVRAYFTGRRKLKKGKGIDAKKQSSE